MTTEEKIKIVRFRLNKAKETYEEACYLANGHKWNATVNRLYYACYYSVTALLAWHEIKTKSHSGVRNRLGFHFVKTGIINEKYAVFYSDIFDMRQASDYEDYLEYEKEDVLILLKPAEEFILQMEHFIFNLIESTEFCN